ncbi:MAG: aminotransferase class I/II-fold pyridoxal phosphate-dependent enzyme [Bacteroidota bacterium]
MAKIIHNDVLDTVDSLLSVSKRKGSIHLHAEDESLTGGRMTIHGRKVLHFGSCGYLGLEHHPDIKKGAIDAIEKYGTQFPMSRTYVSNPLYSELHQKLEEIYGNYPMVVSKNCTLAHLATIPTIIKSSDLIILDHLVHASVQEAAKKMLSQGVKVEMIRHNNLEMLETLILKNKDNYNRIWYMADGVYSMFGDYAPIRDMIELAEKYEQLHLYVDDAHGTSWTGKNGAGYVMSQMNHQLYRKMILTANLGKAFGACGGISIFPSEELQRKVDIFGGPLCFSVQMEPGTLGAAIASSNLHLSEEIYEMQDDLKGKIAYFNQLLKKTDLPLVDENNSPIFFIGVGTMDMGNHIIKEMIKSGIYVNIGAYPAVPAKNIGVRITLNRFNSYEDLETLVDRLEYHFEEALQVTGQTIDKIYRAFKMKRAIPSSESAESLPTHGKINVQEFQSISDLNKEEWNNHLGRRGMFDWDGLHFLERSYAGKTVDTNTWKFRYLVVKDQEGKVILMTFYTSAKYKEDVFANASISIEMEKERKLNPDYMLSKGIFIGSLFTEGNHLFLDQSNGNWKDAVKVLIENLYRFQEEENASNILIRDLETGNSELDSYMMENGFVKLDLPESCIADLTKWNNEEEFLQSLSKSTRKGFKHYVKKHETKCRVEFKKKLSSDELEHAYELHKAVNEKNMAINSFVTPFKAFEEMVADEQWEFGLVYMNDENPQSQRPIVYCFSHINSAGIYSFMLVGMDYEHIYEYSGYRNALWKLINRAKELGCKQANFGISATMEKKRVGARPHPRVGYFQAKDNFALEMMEATIAKERN